MYIYIYIYIYIYKCLTAKYYHENKERLQRKARERYQNISEEEKEKRQQYCCEHYKSLSEDEDELLSIEKLL